MNISYSRSESAPNRSTTSSGFTTLPRDLLILWARAVTLAAGSPRRQYPSPARSTSAAATLAPREPGLVTSDTGPEACVSQHRMVTEHVLIPASRTPRRTIRAEPIDWKPSKVLIDCFNGVEQHTKARNCHCNMRNNVQDY